MGINFIDQYSLLHFAVGIICYFFGFSFINFNILHIIFEYIENTEFGMIIINTYFKDIWPGGKFKADSLLNSTGDIIFGAMGWILAYIVDKYATKYGLYA